MKSAALRSSPRAAALFNLHALGGVLGLAALIAVLPVSIGLVASLSGLAAGPTSSVDVIDFSARRFVAVQEARALIASGALVLDARDAELRQAQPLDHAQPIAWSDLAVASGPHGDRLSDDDATLTASLQALGVSNAQPIVVIGDPIRGHGEDARIVLALRALGHARSVLVDGGLPALLSAGLPTIYPPFGNGDFSVSRQQDWQLAAETLRDNLSADDVAIIETRSDAATTGAFRITLDAFRNAEGEALEPGAIARLLKDHGISDDMRLVTSGSDRDGAVWLAALLLDLGYDVAGYVTLPADQAALVTGAGIGAN
jgi:3-mercaptopyruvate sulfurtransferase SseA